MEKKVKAYSVSKLKVQGNIGNGFSINKKSNVLIIFCYKIPNILLDHKVLIILHSCKHIYLLINIRNQMC